MTSYNMTVAEYQRERHKTLQSMPSVQREAAMLREWRVARGLTQGQMARKFGVLQGNISNAENCRQRVPVKLRSVIGLTD